MLNLLLILIAIVFALQAVRVKRLVRSALWLAGVSAIVSILLFRMGAHEVAVIELSVGAGLVTVLMVFAIAIAGEDAMGGQAVVPRWLAAALVLAALVAAGWHFSAAVAAGWHFSAAVAPAVPVGEPPFSTVLWEQRGLDTLVQVGLIFAGTMGVLGLLSEKEPAIAREAPAPQTVVDPGAALQEGAAP